MLKNTMNKIWNSKAMDMFADVTCGVLETLGEVLVDTFSNEKPGYDLNSGVSYVPESSHETYDYWMGLTYDEQKQNTHPKAGKIFEHNTISTVVDYSKQYARSNK